MDNLSLINTAFLSTAIREENFKVLGHLVLQRQAKNIMYYVLAINLLLLTSTAQEHFTCVKTDNVTAIQPMYSNVRQIRPRRGPRSPRGRPGL